MNNYLLLVIQLNGEKIKLWFNLIQTTLYAIKLSCTHHTLDRSALSLVCLFVCPCFPVPSCLRISLLYSCWCSRPSRALGLPAREPAWPRLVKILPWSRNALFQTLVETTMHNAHHNAQCSSWNIDNTIASKILTVVCSIARHPKFRINLLISSDNSLQGKAFKQMFNQSFQSRKFRKNERKHLLIHDSQPKANILHLR